MSRRMRERRDPEERRAQILDETIRLVGQRGYHGFTIQELASRCGITKGALLYYFRSKEGLLAAALEEYSRREIADMQAFAEERARADGKQGELSFPAVVELLHFMAGRTAAEPEIERLFLVLQAEAMADPAHPANALVREREKVVMEGFTLMLTSHREGALEIARELFAMIEGLTLRWLHADQGFDLVAAWDRALGKILAMPRHD